MADRHFVKMVWVDLDGTLAEYDGWKGIDHIGKPFRGAKEFMEKLTALGELEGFKVGVFTTRTKLDMPGRHILDEALPAEADAVKVEALAGMVRGWLESNRIPFYEVYVGQGKPPGLAYIDDRAVWCNPRVLHNAYEVAIEGVKNLLPGGIHSC